MINTYALQEFFKQSDKYGFSIGTNGGFCRFIAYKASCPIEDVVDSLNYALSRGWIKESGLWTDGSMLYSIVEGAKME